MAAEGETKFGSRDYYLDVILTLGLLVATGFLIGMFKGFSHRFGERIHGYRHDGSHCSEYPLNHPKHKPKKLKPAEDNGGEEDDGGEEEQSFARK